MSPTARFAGRLRESMDKAQVGRCQRIENGLYPEAYLGPLAGARHILDTQVTKPLPAGQEKSWTSDPNEGIRQE